MKNDGFPWTQIGSGPEPRLPDDFASRVIEQAHITRTRRRRMKFAAGSAAGLAALAVIFLSMRLTPANQSAPAQTAHASSYGALSDYNALAWNDQSAPDPLTVLMPSAPPAEKFDAYYGAVSDDTYASWDSTSYDSWQTR